MAGVIQVEYINSCGKIQWIDTQTVCEGNCVPVPLVPTIAASASSICGSEQSVLTAANTNGTVHWYRNGTPTGQTGTSITVSGQGGTFTAKSVTTCGESAASNTAVITYQANCGCSPAPTTPTITSNLTSVCGSNAATLTASGGNGVYRWYQNGSFIGQGPSINVSSTGTYTATTMTACGESGPSNSITVTNTGACPSSFSMTIGTITVTY